MFCARCPTPHTSHIKQSRPIVASAAVVDCCAIQIPQEHAEKLLSGWKKLWYQQLRTQVSQPEVETEAIESALPQATIMQKQRD